MTTRQLHQAVSRATGEDVELIARRGFGLVDVHAAATEDDWETSAFDWDAYDAERLGESRVAA